MHASLLSLSAELVCEVIKDLPIEDARNFLSSCRHIYHNGKYAFDKICFRVLPVRLESTSLANANRIINESQCCFLREVLIRLDWVNDPLHCDITQENVRYNLARLLENGLQASTKCETITIKSNPGYNYHKIKAVAWAINRALASQEANHFNVQIQRMTLYDFRALLNLGKGFLHRVYSLEIIVRKWDPVDALNEALTLMTSLTELSFITDATADNDNDILSSDAISEPMTKVNSERFKSLTLKGFQTTKSQLQEILDPLKTSIKEIRLQGIMFHDGSFTRFVNYISVCLSLDNVSLEEIWEDDGTKHYEIDNPMGLL